jgi:hypothetical protein
MQKLLWRIEESASPKKCSRPKRSTMESALKIWRAGVGEVEKRGAPGQQWRPSGQIGLSQGSYSALALVTRAYAKPILPAVHPGRLG